MATMVVYFTLINLIFLQVKLAQTLFFCASANLIFSRLQEAQKIKSSGSFVKKNNAKGTLEPGTLDLFLRAASDVSFLRARKSAKRWDSLPVNRMIDMSSDPRITYGRVLQEHINRIWNLRISYPDEDILLWDDDVAGCFRHVKHHPDVLPAFGLIIDNLTYF